ncbi:MAG: hypothetical protein AAF938_04335 [Myxococcota bacterium]
MTSSETLRNQYDAACARWPTLRVAFGAFESHVGGPVTHAADAFIVVAYLTGSQGAADLLVNMVHELSASIPGESDELAARCIDHLLFATGAHPPRIASYRGRGRLRTWLRVVASRLSVDSHRGQPNALAEPPSGFIAAAANPEDAVARAELQAIFSAAAEAAFSMLDRRLRRWLRYRYVNGLSIDDAARMQGVHRATAARQMSKAEDVLRKRMYEELAERLRDRGLAPSDAALLTNAELSLSRLLRSTHVEQ